MSLVKCSGKVIFSPNREGLKKTHRSFDTGIILKVDNGISHYYSWLIKRRHGISLQLPAWGTHVTLVSDRDKVKNIDLFNALKDRFNNSFLKLTYDVQIEKHWKFWVLPVKASDELLEIRQSLGLRLDYPLHITIGREHEG